MKKTLFTALLCLGSTAFGASYTLTPVIDGTQTESTANSHGFTFDIGKAAQSSPSALPTTPLTFTSISFTTSGTVTDKKLAIFELPSDLSGATGWADNVTARIQSLGSFVGFSDVGSKDSTNLATFNFSSSLTLNPNGYYAIMYVSSTVAESTFYTNPTGTESNKTAYFVDGTKAALVTPYSSSNSNPFTNMYITGQTSYNARKTAVFTLTASTAAASVPEPATATLSLLALAGLAARRRRK